MLTPTCLSGMQRGVPNRQGRPARRAVLGGSRERPARCCLRRKTEAHIETGWMAGDSIELHVGLLDEFDTSQSFDACWAALSLAEKRRADRFAFEGRRREYAFAHGLLRYALSSFCPPIEPSDWSFTTDRYGRPFVAEPRLTRPFYFSLSHTEGCVACAISRHQAIGIDVERVRPRSSLMETAESVFSPDEINALRDLRPEEFVDRFFDYWTVKEAYVKADGRGLSLPLNRFSMLMGAGETAISFAPDVDDDPRRWRFAKKSPSPTHRLAIADGSGAPGGLLIARRSSPLTCHGSEEPRQH